MAIAAERIRTISVTKMHPVIGAEIGGVDLCRPLDAETLRQINDAWHEHSVLLFRGQSLSEDDQRRFASYFGPVAKRVPPKPGATGVGDAPAWNDMMLVSDKLDADGKPLGTLGHGEMWFHSDKCYHRTPHRARTAPHSSMASRSRRQAATRNFRACMPPMTGCRRTSSGGSTAPW